MKFPFCAEKKHHIYVSIHNQRLFIFIDISISMFWSPYDHPTVLVKCTDVGENTVYNLFQLHEWPKRLYSRFQMDYFYIFSVKKCVRHIVYVVGSLFLPTELIIPHHSLAFSCEIQFCAENKHHICVSIHNQRLFIFIDISISMFWSPYDHPTVLVKCTDVGKTRYRIYSSCMNCPNVYILDSKWITFTYFPWKNASGTSYM